MYRGGQKDFFLSKNILFETIDYFPSAKAAINGSDA